MTRLAWVALALLLAGACKPKHQPALLAQDSSRWAAIESGVAFMGSPDSETCRDPDEQPRSKKIESELSFARYEVTQEEFERLLGYNPSFHRCPRCPVESVSFHEALFFCNKLSTALGFKPCYRCTGEPPEIRCRPQKKAEYCTGFRVPRESEWEYAARAGTRSALPEGELTACQVRDPLADRLAWYKVTSQGFTHPVGKKRPNPWGLYDMTGNVYEWTSDWYDPNRRVVRGGSWYHNAHHLRSANRHAAPPSARLSYLGFRCVRAVR